MAIFQNKNVFRNIFRLFCSWEQNSQNGIQVFRNENSSQTNAYLHYSSYSYSGLIPNGRTLRLPQNCSQETSLACWLSEQQNPVGRQQNPLVPGQDFIYTLASECYCNSCKFKQCFKQLGQFIISRLVVLLSSV